MRYNQKRGESCRSFIPKESQRLFKCKQSSLLWLLFLLYAACIGLLEDLSGLTLSQGQNQLGEQLYHRMAGHQVMAGLVRRASARVTLGIDSDPELTPLYT